MKRTILMVVSAFLLTIFSVNESSAYEGYVNSSVNLRAGPGTKYPIIATIRANRPVTINGCIENWDWCEVESGSLRGWVSGSYLDAVYNNRRDYIVESGPIINIPTIIFEFGSYWDEHYRDRPFYKERDRYAPPAQSQPRKDGRNNRDSRSTGHPENHRFNDYPSDSGRGRR